MNIIGKKILLLTLLLFVSFHINGQRQNFRHFSLKDGLPDASVSSITQSNNGFIYFATENGLSRFDGKATTNYSTSDGLVGNSVNSIVPLNENGLLIGTQSGLSIFDGDKFINYTESNGLISNFINTIFKIGKEYLIGTNNGISLFSNGIFYSDIFNDFFKNHKVNEFVTDSDGTLFIGTHKGLFKILNNSVITINNDIIVKSLLISSEGVLFCGTRQGLYKLENNLLQRVKKFNKLVIYSIFEDDSKRIWLGTNKGIYKIFKNNIRNYAARDSFLGNRCYSIFQDRELNLWFTSEKGVNLYDNGRFQLYNRRDGVKSTVWAIYKTKHGKLWIGTDGNGVLTLKNNEFVETPVLKRLPETIWNIFEDSNNNVWFATNKGAVKLSGKNKLEFYNKNSGFTDDMVIEIYEDKNNTIWLTTFNSGIYKYNGKKFSNIILPNGGLLPTYNIIEDSDSSLWFASSGGLDRIKNGTTTSFKFENIFKQYGFYSIVYDSLNNSILLGSFNRGLIIYDLDDSSFASITQRDGLNDNALLFLKFDQDKSNLWIGTNHGLNKFDYKQYITTKTINITSYNTYDGFPGKECNQLKTIYDNRNIFWFSTIDGIVRYIESKEKNGFFISQPFISSVEINYEKINLSKYGNKGLKDSTIIENIKFPHNMNNLTINFSSLFYSNPYNIKFQYKLNGIDEKLSPPTKKDYVTYSSLSPGDYKFELISFTNNGTVPSKPIYFSFSIETPFWKSNYFYFLLLMLVLSILYGVHRIRISAIRKKNIELLKLYKDNILYQNKILESEKDYKGLFENAHSAILLIDPKTLLVVDLNQSAEILYGYKREELVNMSTKLLSVNAEDTKELINTVTNNKSVKKYRIKHFKKDGSEIILNVNASLTKYKGKTAIISLQRDISEEEETRKQLLFAKESAEKSDKLKSEFLAQVSHEIRTPINTILGYTNLIQEIVDSCDDEEIQSLFPPIKRSSTRIIRTIDLILEMSDINAGTFDLDIQEVEIATTLEEIVIEQRQNAKKKGLELLLINKTEVATLFIDEYTFTQIFVNLIDNAIKYTDVGKIEIILSKYETSTIIEVIDTGIGISDEYLPFLFDSFSQEEQGYTRKYEGNGLGLALVKNYVKINSGKISVKSKKGKGTAFRVKFPT